MQANDIIEDEKNVLIDNCTQIESIREIPEGKKIVIDSLVSADLIAAIPPHIDTIIFLNKQDALLPLIPPTVTTLGFTRYALSSQNALPQHVDHLILWDPVSVQALKTVPPSVKYLSFSTLYEEKIFPPHIQGVSIPNIQLLGKLPSHVKQIYVGCELVKNHAQLTGIFLNSISDSDLQLIPEQTQCFIKQKAGFVPYIFTKQLVSPLIAEITAKLELATSLIDDLRQVVPSQGQKRKYEENLTSTPSLEENNTAHSAKRISRDPREEIIAYPLHHAVKANDKLMTISLLEAYPHIVNSTDQQDATALHWAAWLGYAEIIDELLLSTPNIHAQNINGVQPIHLAAEQNHVEIVKRLLLLGANPRATSMTQSTLHYALNFPNIELGKILLAAGVDPNATDVNGSTPLHIVTKLGLLDYVQLLLDSGANIHALDAMKCSAIFYASFHGHLEVVKLLVARGAQLGSKNAHGETPLHFAGRGGHQSVYNYLIEQGANPRSRNRHHLTPKSFFDRSQPTPVLTVVPCSIGNISKRGLFAHPTNLVSDEETTSVTVNDVTVKICTSSSRRQPG